MDANSFDILPLVYLSSTIPSTSLTCLILSKSTLVSMSNSGKIGLNRFPAFYLFFYFLINLFWVSIYASSSSDCSSEEDSLHISLGFSNSIGLVKVNSVFGDIQVPVEEGAVVFWNKSASAKGWAFTSINKEIKHKLRMITRWDLDPIFKLNF